MSAVLQLTERDHALLQPLVQKVRLFSLRQIAFTWWNGEVANARRRLKQLVAAGWVHSLSVPTRRLPPLRQPVAVWNPATPVADFDAVAYQLQRRWPSTAIRHTTVYIATARLSQYYGGRRRGSLAQPLQATHDLGVSQVWLQLHQAAPAWARAWRSEDLLAPTRHGEKCPDAFLVNAAEQVVGVIEFGGAYHAERLRAFHADCADRGLPYQIW